jgi:hypothetical protein
MILDQLFVQLGFKYDPAHLEEFQQQVAEARATVFTFAAALAAGAGALGLFVVKQAEAIDELGDFAEQEGVAIEAVQELGHAAQLSGSSLDAVKASVQGVNKVVGEAALGIGRGAKTFEKLGMQAKGADGKVKTFDQILAEVADKMQGLSRQESIALAEKLGIDRSLIPLLMKGSEEIQRLRDEAQAFGVTTEEQAAAAGELVDELDRTKFMLGALAKSIAVGFFPQVRNVIAGFRAWVMENRKIIKSGIGAFVEVLATVIGRVWRVLSTLVGGVVEAVSWLMQFKVVVLAAVAALALLAGYQVVTTIKAIVGSIRLATAAMAGFNASVLLIPAAIGAVIIALALLVDDWLAFKAGGESVIGDLVAKFPELEAVLKQVDAALVAMGEYFIGLWAELEGPLGDLLAALRDLAGVLIEYVWPVVKMVFQGWALLIAAVLPYVIRLVAGIIQAFTSLLGFLINVVSGFVSIVTSIFSGLAQFFIGTFKTWQDLWHATFALLTGDFDKAGQHLMAIWQRVVGFFTAGFDKIKGFVGWIGEKLGLSGAEVKVQGAVAAAPAARTGEMAVPGTVKQAAQPGRFAPGGVLGRAESPTTNNASSTVNNNTNATINIKSTDPVQAGREVEKALGQVNKQTTRNGQTAVEL